MKGINTLLLLFAVIFGLNAQTAKLQIIHNSPSPTVDIWVNDAPFLTDVEYRTATPYVEVPAGQDLEIGIAPSPSNDTSDIVADFTINLPANSTNVAIATGIIGDPQTPFNLVLKEDARETAMDTNSVEFFAYHGATDAPEVDVIARDVATLADDLAYGESTGYVGVPAAEYTLDVTPANDNEIIVASFAADLSGLEGGSAVVFASGFLSPPAQGDPEFGLFAALADGTVVPLPAVENTARLQIIHNSPSPTVDIWVNNAPFLTDVEYRTATSYLDVPAGQPLEIGVAPSPSNDTSDIIATFEVNFAPNSANVAIASGIVGDTTTPFTLALKGDAREMAMDTNSVEFFAYHGATDAPEVDVIARDVATLADDLAYGESTDYVGVPAAEYTLDVTPANANDVIVASFAADLSGLEGGSAVVFASGFLSPPMQGDPEFGLFAALADGTVVPLPSVENTAKLQIIHNSADPTVDIWVNNAPFLTEFEYRDATPYVEVPAGQPLEIGVAPSPSDDTSDIIATFEVNFAPNSTNVAIATGIVGDPGTPFDLVLNTSARDTALSDDVEFFAYHGSTNAPPVDVVARNVGVLVDELAYGETTDYVAVPPAEYILDLTPAGLNDILVASFAADLTSLGGESAVIFASGTLGAPPNLGLFAALADGTVVELPRVQNTAELQIIHNAPSPTVDLYVYDQPLLLDFEYRTATSFLEVSAGIPLEIGIAPSPSGDTSDVIKRVTINLEPNSTNVAIATGIAGDADTPLDIVLKSMARTEAEGDDVDFFAYHGATDAPAVDVIARDVGTLVDGFSYGDTTSYISVPPAQYTLDITPDGNNDEIVASFDADLSTLGGGSAVVFASGFLNPPSDTDPAFGLFAALADGTIIELPQVQNTAKLQIIHNSPSPTVDIWVNNEPFLTDFEYRTATPYVDVPGGQTLEIGVAPSPSDDTSDIIATFDANFGVNSTNVAIATGIVGDAETPFNLVIKSSARDTALSDNVEFFAYHGSTDAPAVDVIARGVATLVDNFEYGDTTAYVEVPASMYVLDVTPADDNNTVVASFDADLSTLAGGSAVVFASGFLNPPMQDDPEFGLYVSLADGTTFPLPMVTSTTDPAIPSAQFKMYPNPVVSDIDLDFTLTEQRSVQLSVIDANGKLMKNVNLGSLGVGAYSQTIAVNDLPSGMYLIQVISDQGIMSKRFVKQ
jgi:hypothetical protein